MDHSILPVKMRGKHKNISLKSDGGGGRGWGRWAGEGGWGGGGIRGWW